jgi:hypothetical protein
MSLNLCKYSPTVGTAYMTERLLGVPAKTTILSFGNMQNSILEKDSFPT